MTRFNLKKLKTRTASALVIAPATMLIIWYNGWPFVGLLLALGAISLYEWFNLSKKMTHPLPYILAGLLYVVLIFGCYYFIRDTQGLSLSLMFVCMVWASDIGAFFTGKMIGGPKMTPSISPNKTWAGFGGALFFPGLVALIWMHLLGYTNYAEIFVGGALVGFTGQAGDLLISFLKRRAGVKDTGNLIPGHGGLLDRIDSLMLAAPVFLALALLVFHG